MGGISGMAVGKKAMWADRARTFALCCLAVVVAVVIGVLLATKPAHARTFTVTNTNASGAGSLDQQITKANNNDNTPLIDAIKFNIPTTDPGFGLTTPGVFTISSTSALTQITEPLTIDGYSQGKATTNTTADDAKPNTKAVGNNAVLKIELRRTVSGAGAGLWIGAKNTTIKGLVINRWEEGVRISGSGSRANTVAGNFIGTDASGTQDPDGSLFGVSIVDAPSNTVGGTTPAARNVISGNDQSGISISGTGATANKVMGNYMGTNANGTERLGNSTRGVFVFDGAANNTVGGTTVGARNVISGNTQGVLILGAGATDNKVMGNYIGTDRSGTLARGNHEQGVLISDAPNNTVGGTTAGARNIISGNGSGDGVTIFGAGARGNKVMGNYVGTDVTGTQNLGNSFHGVLIDDAPNNTIGGTVTRTSNPRNIISGNSDNGVTIDGFGATGNKVMGNYIGTKANGLKDLGNSDHGVVIEDASNNTIGGTVAGARNIVSGNHGRGVRIFGADASGNMVMGNYVGTDKTGTADLGNTFDGVSITYGTNNTIGGTTGGVRNIISGNGENGVRISGAGATANKVIGNYVGTDKTGTADLGNTFDGVLIDDLDATGNRILSNSIYFNNGLGIGLDFPGGPTANDDMDPDIGPNNLQNFPMLSSATKTGDKTTITGTLNSTPSATFTIQFFSSPLADPSGHGEGKNFLGQTSVTTNGSGNASFTATTPVVPAGQVVSATATGADGTSEFSVAVTAS